MAQPEHFGTTEAGEPVQRITLTGGGLTANVMTWGAVVQDLRLDGHAPPLVLGFDTFDHYPAHSPYFGAIAGRVANRIGEGRFDIDGVAYQTDQNFLGTHTLHGGSKGIGKQNWDLVDWGSDFATLSIDDPDGG